jgi:hypothetical protein
MGLAHITVSLSNVLADSTAYENKFLGRYGANG